jgi:hypothetical protein
MWIDSDIVEKDVLRARLLNSTPRKDTTLAEVAAHTLLAAILLAVVASGCFKDITVKELATLAEPANHALLAAVLLAEEALRGNPAGLDGSRDTGRGCVS